MEIRKSSGLLACAGLLALTLLSGCGSKTSTTTIPQTATIFYVHNILFRNNTAMTLGYNGFGQLGQGNLSNLAVATIVPNTGPVNGGATGGEHTLAASFGNRTTVMAWGYNLYGQLGSAAVTTASTTSSYSATPVTVTGLGGTLSGVGGKVTSVAAGGYHSLAVAGGVVFAWGYNGFGQLGNNTFANAPTPVLVKVPLNGSSVPLGGPLTPAIQVAAGGNHSLALLSDGSVWAWGRNSVGELGVDPASINAGFTPTPVPVSFAPHKIIQIVAQGLNSYALRDDFTVWAWGYNVDSELGANPVTTPFSFTPLQVWKDAAKTTPLFASKIAAGGNHVLAMQCDVSGKPDGTLWAWGYNGFAQLGNALTTINANSFVPVAVGHLPTGTLADIRAFGDYSMLKTTTGPNGTWFGWGDNGFGQLGNPVSTTSIGFLLVPTLVQGY